MRPTCWLLPTATNRAEPAPLTKLTTLARVVASSDAQQLRGAVRCRTQTVAQRKVKRHQ